MLFDTERLAAGWRAALGAAVLSAACVGTDERLLPDAITNLILRLSSCARSDGMALASTAQRWGEQGANEREN